MMTAARPFLTVLLALPVLVSCNDPAEPNRPIIPAGDFAFMRGQFVYLGNINSGTLTALLPDVTNAEGLNVWSPDGRILAVVVGGTVLLTLDVAPLKRRVLDVDGSGPDSYHFENMAWSPTGDRIAFQGGPAGREIANSDIYTIRPDGSGLTNLTQSPAIELHPRWSHDGRHVVYVKDTDTGYELWITPANGGTKRFLARGQRPEWSPDGRRIAFDDNTHVHVINADGSGKITILRPAQETFDQSIFARWSPGSDRIVFTGGYTRTNIWVSAADGSGLTQLTTSGGTNPQWSPDGEHILYVVGGGIKRIGPDGTGERVVVPYTAATGMHAPVWRPSPR